MKLYSTFLLWVVVSASIVSSYPSSAQNWVPVREKAKDSTFYLEVTQQKRDGTGRQTFTATGFVISEIGGLTVAHAVPEPSPDTIVEYHASIGSRHAHKFPVEVIARDPALDLAVLAFPELQTWKPVEFGESLPVPADARLYVLGFPLNADLSSADGLLRNRRGPGGRWQTTLPLNYGNSGGPVFDIGGKVIGIAAGGFDQAQLMTIVIPADYARPLRSMVRAAALKSNEPGFAYFPFVKSVEDQQAAELAEEFCLPAGKRVVSFSPQILSQNGQNTRLLSAKTDPNRPNCIDFKAEVVGNGVEQYGSIVVGHKGRGWLSGYIKVYGTP